MISHEVAGRIPNTIRKGDLLDKIGVIAMAHQSIERPDMLCVREFQEHVRRECLTRMTLSSTWRGNARGRRLTGWHGSG